MEKKLRFYVDLLEKETDRLCIHGWAVGAGEVALSLRDARGDEIEVQTDRFCRPDVNALLHLEEDYKAGYQIILPLIRADGKPWRRLTVTADDGAHTARKTVFLHLTELMGGEMVLTLDGDLFKVEVSFPNADPPQLPAEPKSLPEEKTE